MYLNEHYLNFLPNKTYDTSLKRGLYGNVCRLRHVIAVPLCTANLT